MEKGINKILKELRKVYDRKTEHFYAVCIKDGIVKYKDVTLRGSNNDVYFYKEDIIDFVHSVGMDDFYICHNHPDDAEIDPSIEDRIVTHNVYEMARKDKTHLVDHIIIKKDEYYSFAENKLIGKSLETQREEAINRLLAVASSLKAQL